MTPREFYRQWANEKTTLPIFLQPWWLDAVCPDGTWDIAIVQNKDQKLIAALPFYRFNKKGIDVIGMPFLTPYMGIYIDYPAGQKLTTRNDYEKELIDQLTAQIPRVTYFQQKFFPPFQYGLPFFWKGYRLDWRYTYYLSLQKSKEELWDMMEGSARTQYQKTSKIVSVEKSDDTGTLYRLVNMTFNKQGLKTPYSLLQFDRLYNAVKAHSSGQIYLARINDSKQAVAGMFMVKDQDRVYNLVLGRDHVQDPGGSIHGILWTCIQEHLSTHNIFDFEGSMLEGPERMFRSFGSERIPVLQVTKYKSRWWKAMFALIGK